MQRIVESHRRTLGFCGTSSSQAETACDLHTQKTCACSESETLSNFRILARGPTAD
jgi:hypothetical protein